MNGKPIFSFPTWGCAPIWAYLEKDMQNQHDDGSGKWEEDGSSDFPDERIKREIAERLRHALKLAGGPSRVSAHSGVSLRTISNYTSERSELKASALVRLAEACGVSVEWLATGRTTPDAAPRSDAEERLKAIKAALDEEAAPISAERLRERPELAEIRGELEALSRSDLPDAQRGFADLLLRLAFDDTAAEERQHERQERLFERLRASGAAYEKAVEVVAWEPPPSFGQALRTLCFNYGIRVEDAISLLDALKYDFKKRGP